MKNYTLKLEEEKDFIIKYEIDKDTNEIVVYYANETTSRIPNNTKSQLELLEKMKKQVEYYRNFEEDAKKEIKGLRIEQLLELILAIIATIFVGILGVKAFTIGWKGLLLTPVLAISGLVVIATKMAYTSVCEEVDKLKERIRDFKKSLFFLKQEKVFTNERLLRPDVRPKLPHRVRKMFEKENKDQLPIINFNNIEDIPMHDLKKTYDVSLQSHGPVLTMKPINKKKNN